jgi:hypothetical protein
MDLEREIAGTSRECSGQLYLTTGSVDGNSLEAAAKAVASGLGGLFGKKS